MDRPASLWGKAESPQTAILSLSGVEKGNRGYSAPVARLAVGPVPSWCYLIRSKCNTNSLKRVSVSHYTMLLLVLYFQ